MKLAWSGRTAIGAILLLLPVVVASQAPVDLSGKWTLDTYLSDNPEQIAAALRIDTGQGGGEALFGEAGAAGAFGRGGGGRRASGRGGDVQSRQPSADEQKRIDEL